MPYGKSEQECSYFDDEQNVLWRATALVEWEYEPPAPHTWDSDWDYNGVEYVSVIGFKEVCYIDKEGQEHKMNVEDVEEFILDELDENAVKRMRQGEEE